ncbi:SOS response-associated peptidase family protein [Dyadobacter sp. NIV53]|uniref:SOS response-associated peptidase family protein n=1 Tax=Dyadobacter sp. NIV53 TaxID=2861765 RepID=UPI001C886D14|nr:SOS response-associated peptidase family protein [Dyadobacter sp. NIV53]
MCYHKGLIAAAPVVEKRFEAKFENPNLYKPVVHSNGFQFPLDWVITRKDPHQIKSYRWGLIPHWARSVEEAKKIRAGTLNARLDTLDTLPSFRDAVKFRCLIPVSHFYEYQWTDLSKKNAPKNIFRLTRPDEEVFLYRRHLFALDQSG